MIENLDQNPHNIDAEQALIGTLLVNNDAFDTVFSLVQGEHFFDPIHAKIFEIIENFTFFLNCF